MAGMSGKPRGAVRMGQPFTFRFMPSELLRWKADAARKGRKFSAHVRIALDAELERSETVVSVKEREPDPVSEAVRMRGATPFERVFSGSSGCPADVSRGVRCRLCHKIH